MEKTSIIRRKGKAMIRIKNLFKRYFMGKENLAVLNDINLEIRQGEFIAILGASGCGKSTLLNIIGGLDKEIDGQIYLDDLSVRSFKEKDWNRWRKQSIGFIFQNFNLIPHLTAMENVALAMKMNGCGKEEIQKRARELIGMVGLSNKCDYLPSQLSGGQKQRVAIARAMANHPRIILADEPTGALDTASAGNVMDILHAVNRKSGVTIVMVTHNKELAKEADRIVYMKDGQIEKVVSNVGAYAVMEHADYSEGTGKLSKASAVEIGIRNVIAQKKRSLLTIFGTAVGITGMVLMMGIGNGAQDKINHELGSFIGDKTIWVSYEDTAQTFSQKDVEQLGKIDGVKQVLDDNTFEVKYYYNNVSAEGRMDVLGPAADRTEYEASLADIGTLPQSDDSKEILLPSDIAKKLLEQNSEQNTTNNVVQSPIESVGPEDLIGKKITVLLRLLLSSRLTDEVEETFTVVGITDSGVIPKYSYIPYETAAKIAEESANSTLFFQEGAELVAADQADYSKVVKEIEALGYKASTNQEGFEEINTLVMGLKVFLIFIAAVALLVSGIMIKIVLHTNVVERTREIGIMCAIGAGRRDVKRIFVAEAGILGLLAGVMGVILGQSLGAVLNATLHSSFQGMNFNLYIMNVKTVLFCIMISVTIAVLAGRKPARKAAGIDPAIALRYE